MNRIRRFEMDLVVMLSLAVFAVLPAHGQRVMEKLGRSVVAITKADGSIYVGWRLVGTDPEDIGFNLYRVVNDGAPVQLVANKTNTTDYVDTTANLTQTNKYYVRPVINGVEGAPSGSFTIPANTPIHESYIRIPYTFNPGDPTVGGSVDAEVGDFDGDGEYEYMVKWSHDGYCDPGDRFRNTDSYKLDAYKLNGTKLWRIDLGINCKTSPEFTPTVVADLDGDGIAEIITKVGEGSVDGTGAVLGDVNGDGITDYRTSGPDISYNSPEFLAVYSGVNGKLLAYTNWIPIGGFGANGYNDPNRDNRNNMTVAYLDGVRPSIIMCRGIYEAMKMEAWNFRNGQLTNVWKWSSTNDPVYQQWQVEQGVTEGKGSHMIRSGDVDGDGRDETLRGSLTMGPVGSLYYTKPTGHGDEMRFGDLDPDRPGLEVWMGYEAPANPIGGMQLYDAATGKPVFGLRTGLVGGADVGSSQTAPFDAAVRGFQGWGYDGLYDTKGNLLTKTVPGDGTRHEAWWDGKLTRNLVDEARIYVWNTATLHSDLLYDGDASDGGFGYSGEADVLGDWREEIISARKTEVRIYTTTFSATNRLYTLMHDPVYRLSAAVQAQRKVPTSTPGFYLGPGMLKQPIAPISDADLVWSGGGGNVWDTSTTNWHVNWYWSTNEPPAAFTSGKSVLFDLTGVSTNPVSLSGTLMPSAIKVHTANNYTFSGSGSLSGGMKLTKAGVGTLTINTTNSFTGATLVAEGRLLVNGRLDQSPVTVRGGSPWGATELGGRGTLANGVTAEAGGGISPGQGIGSAGILRVANGLMLAGGSLNNFDLSDDPTGTTKTNDLIAVTGNVTLTGTNTITVKKLDGVLTPGLYPLVTYSGSLSGGISKLVVKGIPEVACVLTNPPGQIALLVRSTRPPTSLTWMGGQGNVWDLATRTNWLNGGVQDWFIAGDTVRFDSTGSANPMVMLNDAMVAGNVVVDATSDYTISGSGSLDGSGGLIKTNSGKLTLLTKNTYTGPTVLSGGTTEVDWIAEAGKATPLGLGSTNPANLVIRDGGQLRVTPLASLFTDRGVTLSNGVATVDVVTSSTDLSLYGLITGSGTLLKTGAGMLDLNGNNTYTGGTIIDHGKLVIRVQSALGTGPLIFTNGGVLDGAAGTFNRPIILQSGGGVFACATTVPTQISGPGSLTFNGGSATLTLSGANTYSGGTIIGNGPIWITALGALGSGPVTVSDGGALVLRPGATLVTNALTINGFGAGATSGAYAAIYLYGSDGTFTGPLTLSGDAKIGSPNTAGLDLTLNGLLNLGSYTLSLAPNIATSGIDKWVINGVISGTGNVVWDTVDPNSTLTLTAANTFSGKLLVNDACRLVVSNTLALQNSTLLLTNGSVRFGNNISSYLLGSLSGDQNLSLATANGAALTLSVGNNNLSTLYSGAMSGGGSLVKVGTGTFQLTGANSYAGTTVVNNGTMLLSGSISNSSSMTVQSGATLQLDAATLGVATTMIATNGTLTGCGTLTGGLVNNGWVQLTCGSMIINGPVTNNGTITLAYGMTLTFNGPVVNNGIVDASAGGTIIANSTWTGNPYISVPPGGSYTNAVAGNWSQVAWQPAVPPSGIRTTNVFNNGATINSTNDLGSFNLNQLRFDNRTVNLVGNPLVFGGEEPAFINQQNYASSVANAMTLNQDTRFNINSNTTTLSGAVSGVAGLIKDGAGTLALTAANSYAGGTVIAGGTLGITSDSQLGAAGTDVTLTNGGTLRVTSSLTLNRKLKLETGGGIITNTATLTLNDSISGIGGFTKAGSGQLSLSKPSTYSGGTWINAGAIKLVSANADSIFGTGDVTVAGGAQIWDNAGGANDRVWNNDFIVSGDGGGNGAIYLNSGATITVGGTLTLAGNAKIAAANSSGVYFVFANDVNLGAYTLTLKSGSSSSQTGWAINGKITGTGGLVWPSGTSASSTTLALSGSNSFSGTTTLGGSAKLALNNLDALKNSTLNTGPAGGNQAVTFTVPGVVNTYNIGGLSGADDIAIGYNTINVGANGADTSYSGVISGPGGLIKSGGGTLTLSGANTYGGGTTISNGALLVNSTGALGTGDLTVASGAGCTVQNNAGMASSASVYLNGVLNIASGVNLTVQQLFINGQLQADGVWNAARDAAHFAGGGNLIVTTGASVLATTGVWTNLAGGLWTVAGNWTNGLVPMGADVAAEFSRIDITANTTVHLNQSLAIGNLAFGDASGNSTWTLDNNGNSANVLTLASSNSAVRITVNTDTTLGVQLAGTNALTKSGPGVLNLTVANTYSGGTSISNGTINITADSALGTVPGSATPGNLILNNGTLSVSSASGTTINANRGAVLGAGGGNLVKATTGRLTYAGVIVGTGALTFNAAVNGSEYAPGAGNTYSGGTTLLGHSNATMVLNGGSSGSPGNLTQGPFGIGPVVFGGPGIRSGTGGDRTVGNEVSIAADMTFPTISSEKSLIFSGPVTLSGGNRQLTVEIGDTDSTKSLTISGAIGDAGDGYGLIKAGAGVLKLSGTNTYTGSTVVKGGTLRLAHDQCLSAATTVWLYTGATNDLAFVGTNTIAALYLDGQALEPGVYGSAELPMQLMGTGYLKTLSPALTGYAAWASQISNGQTGYNVSASGDGYPNLLKYATGSSPTNSDMLACLKGVVTNGVFTLIFNRNTNATDVTLVVETTSQLGNGTIWNGVATNADGFWMGAPNVSESGSESPVCVTVQQPGPTTTNQWYRLRVTIP